MLPKDRKSQKEDLQPVRQTQLNGHLQPNTPKHSDERFHAAGKYGSGRWHSTYMTFMLTLPQPIPALKHPSFKKVIKTAVQVTNSVKIPCHKYT